MTPVNGESGTGVMKMPLVFWVKAPGTAAKTRKTEKIPARAARERIGNLHQRPARIDYSW
jgi:hypothetical protein